MPSQFYDAPELVASGDCAFCPCDPDEDLGPTVRINLRGQFVFGVCFECLAAFCGGTITMLSEAMAVRAAEIEKQSLRKYLGSKRCGESPRSEFTPRRCKLKKGHKGKHDFIEEPRCGKSAGGRGGSLRGSRCNKAKGHGGDHYFV